MCIRDRFQVVLTNKEENGTKKKKKDSPTRNPDVKYKVQKESGEGLAQPPSRAGTVHSAMMKVKFRMRGLR